MPAGRHQCGLAGHRPGPGPRHRLGMAAAVVLSVCIGRRDAAEEHRALGSTAVLLLLAGVLSTALLALLYRPLLPLLGAEGSVLAYADSYTRVIVLGSLFQVLGTGLVPLLRTYDGADAAMCSMTAGFLTNVVLDALFISVFRWGTAGAAAATVIAQGVSAALGLVYLFRVKRVFRGVSFRLNRRTVLRLLATSLSPFGLTMLNTVTLVVINRGALAYGGSLAVACYAVMSYAICMVHFIIQGIGDGAQPLLSRYYGAGEQEALAQVRTLTFRSAPAAALLCGIALFLGRSAIPHLFGASNAATRAVPGNPAPVPALSPVHVGSAHPDLLLLRHRADHPGRPADLRPARRVGGPLPDPAPHWAGAVRGLAVRPPDPDPAGRRRGAAAAHRSRRDRSPSPPPRPSGRPLRLSVCVTWMPTGPYPKNGCAPSFREGAQLFLFIAKISTLSGSAPPAPTGPALSGQAVQNRAKRLGPAVPGHISGSQVCAQQLPLLPAVDQG